MKISVVIVTYNSCDSIGPCLDSVLAQESDLLDGIIVVDNGSFDSTLELLKARYPQVRVIPNDHNAGPAQARNQGIRHAQGEWILCLDSDARLKDNFFLSFDQFLKRPGETDDAGIVVPKIYYDDAKTIYSVGNRLTPLRRFYDVGRGDKDRGQFDGPREVFGACSAVAFYRRRMLLELKDRDGFFFDQDFFFMAEDVDLAWRARQKGWKVYFCPACIGYHAGNGSRTTDAQKNYYSIRNRFVMVFKNDRRGRIVLFLFPLLAYEIFRSLFLLIKGKGKLYAAACASAAEIIRKKTTIRRVP